MGAKAAKVHQERQRLQVGGQFPDAELYEHYPSNEHPDLDSLLRGKPVQLSSLLKGKKCIVLGIPGAFTPNCTQFHLPGYVERYDEFKSAGADYIICLAANDVFVCKNWGDSLGATGKVLLLSDPQAQLAEKAGVALDLTATLGRVVYKRFSAIVEDGVVRLLFVEPDGLGLQCTTAVPMLSEFSTQKYRRMIQT